MKFMKLATLGLLALALVSVQGGCKKSKEKETATCYKGRLELKGICANYTISVPNGQIDSSLVERSWRNEANDSVYQNVFGLASPCTFPANLQQGDEFYFTIDSSAQQNCAVCMAYYPTPQKKLSIRVLPGSCGSQP